jgi:hypothetical protein
MNTLHSKIAAGVMLSATTLLLFAGMTLAQNASSTSSAVPTAAERAAAKANAAAQAAANRTARTAARMTAAEQKGLAAVDKRITDLGTLVTRVQSLKNVSDSQKTNIVTTVQNLSANLAALQMKIQEDTSSSTLRDDLTSITGSYRIYALVMPEVRIIASADRIVTVSGMINILATKVSARLSQAGTVPNLSALTADMADVSAKIADAMTQAQAAVAEVTPLTPDQGDKTKMAANTAALKDARSKISAAETDIKAAYKDISTVLAAVKKIKPVMTPTATPTDTSTTTVNH